MRMNEICLVVKCVCRNGRGRSGPCAPYGSEYLVSVSRVVRVEGNIGGGRRKAYCMFSCDPHFTS